MLIASLMIINYQEGNLKVVIAAAGTGGHINPGIAIANKIKKEEPWSEITFIGTPRGLEKDLVKRAGYKLKTIDSYGIPRKPTPKNIVRLIKTIRSIGQAKKILKELKPDVVVGTGGYICISVCLAAQKLKIPYIIHESNVLPGVSTKILSKKAAKILVGFKESKDKLPEGTKISVTGTPTKNNDLKYDENMVQIKKQAQGLDGNKPLVLVFGGSQGAKSINSSMTDIIKKKIKDSKKIKIAEPDYEIAWASGPLQYDIVKKEMLENDINIDNIKGIKILPYIYNMEEMLNICDLVVCRSGAMTITEIEKIGKPAIFIPFPFAAENHQEYNARMLEKVGAAKVILDKDLDSEKLNNTIIELIKNKEKLSKMGEKAKKQSINNVEQNIYDQIKKVIKS